MRMEANEALLVLAQTPESMLDAINRCIEKAGVFITLEDARALEEQRTEALLAVERVEFGTPAVVAIAEEIGESPYLTQTNAAATLARLQNAFYYLRDELPIEVPDEEIVEAIRNSFDGQGDAAEVAAMSADELMAYSEAYVRAQNEERLAKYRIVDDEGRAYSFSQAEWGVETLDHSLDGTSPSTPHGGTRTRRHQDGTEMTGTISDWSHPAHKAEIARACAAFAKLLTYVAKLYCMDDSSSISAFEAQQLATSVAYVLGIAGGARSLGGVQRPVAYAPGILDATPEEVVRVLNSADPIDLWHEGLAILEKRVDTALKLRCEILSTMPPIPNIALRDTLTSLGKLKKLYDMRFAAHEVSCSIDYQLSEPVDTLLMGMDYIEAWLEQLLKETRWIAQFTTESCVAVLEHVCPDYCGLHVNLYDLLLPHKEELTTKASVASRFVLQPYRAVV